MTGTNYASDGNEGVNRVFRRCKKLEQEIERLQTAEADLYDKCGELQRRVWKLEAARAAGGGDE